MSSNTAIQDNRDTAKILTVRIPADLDKRLEIETAHADMTKQAIVTVALDSYLSVVEAAR